MTFQVINVEAKQNFWVSQSPTSVVWILPKPTAR
jgi:hypothetical protein